MKAMFVASDKDNVKRKIQKPNILRKNSKFPAPKPSKLEKIEMKQPALQLLGKNKEIILNNNPTTATYSEYTIEPLIHKVDDSATMDQGSVSHVIEIKKTTDSAMALNPNSSLVSDFNMDKSSEEDTKHSVVNIEAFFNDSPGEKLGLYDIDYDSVNKDKNMIIDKSVMDGVYIDESSIQRMSMVPLSTITIQDEGENQTTESEAALDGNSLTTLLMRESDTPSSTVETNQEQKPRRRHVYTECPVKKIEVDGTQNSCGKMFNERELLAKHLNEDHTLDEAVYSCDDCGRRFFWLSGLRAHTRAHCRREGPPLACTWAGCGRVFRHPCRLREHARSHTGDRPYPCRYPGCGWSFRSASKLLRHARRHTGERRHACAACPRAFLRREHLRDHHARYHARPRRAHACPHAGCEQTFNNMSTLYMHMKKAHKNKAISMTETTITETSTDDLQTVEGNSFLLNLDEPEAMSTVSVEVCDGDVIEQDCQDAYDVQTEDHDASDAFDASDGRAARTHCTWPLQRPQPATVEDYNAEQSEDNSESNIYTVRSDLFLHGNVLINEDSVPSGGTTGTSTVLDSDLGILDAHPTVDLMQEELLYTDVANDESSFRIFLLSGEELT
ncbi:hypothetical protein ACJJTC_012650 [Scirpophaga incertulas]